MAAARLPENLPSVEYLHECLSYCPETGVLTWKHRPREHFTCARGHQTFLSKFSGKVAGADSLRGYLFVGITYLSTSKMYYAHRVAWALHYGQWPTCQIDHVNGQRDDNRIVNLRDVTCGANHRNKAKNQFNSSGHNGIAWDPRRCKWRARVMLNQRDIHLGYFDDIADAIASRERANERMDFSKRHGLDLPKSYTGP